VFTAGLVEGLRTGAADTGGDGYVTVDEAYDFAFRYVLSLGAAQTPQRWLSGGEGALVLARSPAGIAITPATLPGELADALESRYPAIRVGAVHELGSWLAGDDPGHAVAAEDKLRQISDNDNHTVATVARAYLTSPNRAATRTNPQVYSAAKDETTAAAPVGKVPEPVRRTPDRAARLLADAERAALATTDEVSKAIALCDVATALATTNPDQAARLFADAERIARSITTESNQKAMALRVIARALAATDPGHAERIAQSINDWLQNGLALRDVATTVAANNPDQAERIARSVPFETDCVWALRDVGKALTVSNPDHADRLLADAQRIAQSFGDSGNFKAEALRGIATALAVTNPDRAERIAQSITDEDYKAQALREIATALAATDPDRAERIAQSIATEKDKAQALVKIAMATVS
jgi:hypothetical protein